VTFEKLKNLGCKANEAKVSNQIQMAEKLEELVRSIAG
jgi:hypothetical protein